MDTSRVLLLLVLALAVLSCCCGVVRARPHRAHQSQAVEELTDIASNMAHTLEEVISMLGPQRSRSRRRRMVQFHVGRHHHYYHNRHRLPRASRRLRYRKQRASRNPDISDH